MSLDTLHGPVYIPSQRVGFFIARKRHPDPTIEKALKHAEEHGWRVERGSGRSHAWGKMYCPHEDDECRCGEFCITSVWSTPRSPENHARRIRRVVDGYVAHRPADGSGEEESRS